MIVLAVDCSTRWTNVGVADGSSVLAERNLELGRSQSTLLPQLAEEVLAEAKISLCDVELLAAGVGPGYYTGIRAGISYAAGLARALKRKVVPLCTLELLVFDLRQADVNLASVIRARRDHVYAALYASDGGVLREVIPPAFCSAAEFAAALHDFPDALLVGADAGDYQELSQLPNRMELRFSGFGGQAAIMGGLSSKSAVDPSLLRGVYLRGPDIGTSRKDDY